MRSNQSWASIFLILVTRDDAAEGYQELSSIFSTASFESTYKMRFRIFSCQANLWPYKIPHSSAIRGEQLSNLPLKPLTQEPIESPITPPTVLCLELWQQAPSVLSLYQDAGGGFQKMLRLDLWGKAILRRFSCCMAWFILATLSRIYRCVIVVVSSIPKTSWFHCVHTNHMPIPKIVAQFWFIKDPKFSLRFVSTQLLIGGCKIQSTYLAGLSFAKYP